MLRLWGSNCKRFRPFAARLARGFVLLALLLVLAAPGWAVEYTVKDFAELKKHLQSEKDGNVDVYVLNDTVKDGDIFNIAGDIELNQTLKITKSVTLKAAPGAHPVLDRGLKGQQAAENGRVIKISGSGVEVTIDGLTITGGKATNGGGMHVYLSATANVTNCTFTNNTANNGGGMYVDQGATANVTNCTFTDNTADDDGGGMYVYLSATANVANCTFNKNTARSDGGGMYVDQRATVNVTNCTFTDNTAQEKGPEVYLYYGALNAVNTIFWNDTTDKPAIEKDHNGTLNLYNCAYRSGSVTPDNNNGGNIIIAGWPGSREVKDAKGTNDVTHTVFKLTAADKDTLIDGGITTGDVYTAVYNALKKANLDSYLAKDQLGTKRPQGKGYDIGAVEFIPVTGVSLNKTASVEVGKTVTLTATVTPDSASDKTVKWSVDDKGTDSGKVALYSDEKSEKAIDSNNAVTAGTVYVKGIKAGTATVTVASNESADIKATCTVTVNKGTPKVTAPTAKSPLKYDGKAQKLITPGTTTGGTMVYSLDGRTYSDKIPTGKNAGKYTVYYKVEGGENYIDVTPENNTLEVTIGRADIQPSVSITGWTYGQAANAPSVSSNPGSGTVTYAYKVKDAADSTYSATVPSAVGSYTVRATVAETANYNGGTATADFTISTATDTDNNGNNSNSSNSGNNTGSETVSPDKEPDPELTPEEQKAVEEAQKKLDQDTKQKAEEAKRTAETVDTTTEGGRALADLMSGNAQGSTKATQAAALEVKQALEETGTDLSTLTAHDVEMAVQNKAQARQDKVDEVNGKVKDPKVPAATDLLTEYGSNTDLQDANEKLTVQPKLVQPEVLSATSRDQAVKNIQKAATGELKVAEGVNFDAVQAANRDGLKTSADITIEPVSKDLGDQTKAVEKVFNAVSADLAGANEGKGVVIATVLPKMTPKASGFFPLRVNLRHLMPGRRLRFWPSAAHFKQASGKAAVSLAAAGQEEDHFFLDENGVPTATVCGDASKMTAVAYLTANVPYEDAFITVDATSADQPALTELAEKANPNGGENSPTSNKGSGGCDAGLGLAALTAVISLLARRKK